MLFQHSLWYVLWLVFLCMTSSFSLNGFLQLRHWFLLNVSSCVVSVSVLLILLFLVFFVWFGFWLMERER